MTVVAAPMAIGGTKPLAKSVFRVKPMPETRPVTATLECPAILDITFLKKLDMTSFTKKGLIAISKICGISLIKRTDDKKIRKRLKRHTNERVKKELRNRTIGAESSEEQESVKPKCTSLQTVPKIKVSDSSVRPRTEVKDMKSGKAISPRRKEKPSVDDILYGTVELVVTEPCKTCGRSEQPERFHSHPKRATGKKQQHKSILSLDDKVSPKRKFISAVPESAVRRHSIGHLQSEGSSRLVVVDLEPSFHSDHEIESVKMMSKKIENSLDNYDRAKSNLRKKAREKSSFKMVTQETNSPSKYNEKRSSKTKEKDKRKSEASVEDMKYITGCYVCGEQMSPEVRFAHEEQCIAEWRKQNSHLPPDERKAEPLRPDFRFTATGAVDLQGTFQSIWANHMDSLVPCAKCKRTFFPERLEKHEACCTKQFVRPKFSTPRK